MLNEALKYIRKFHGETLKELAASFEVSPSFISEIENGKKKISLDLIEKYSKYYGIKKSAILFFAEDIELNKKRSKSSRFFRDRIIKLLRYIDKLESEIENEALM